MTILKILMLATYGFCIARFCGELLGNRFRPFIAAICLVLYEILIDHYIIGILIFNLNLINNFSIASWLSQLGLTAMILILFRGAFSKRIALAMVVFVIYELVSYAIVPFMSIVTDIVTDMSAPEWIFRLYDRLRYAVCCVILIIICRRCIALGSKAPRKAAALLMIPSFFIAIIIDCLYNLFEFSSYAYAILGFASPYPSAETVSLVGVSVLLVLSILGLWTSLTVVFGVNTILTQALSEQQLSMQIEQYQHMERQNVEINQLRHDFKNHAIILSGLLREENTAEANAYLKRISDSVGLLAPVISSGNSAADALLNVKRYESEQAGIVFQCDLVFPPMESVDNFDLCVILGNALDNAIEACKRSQQENRFIRLRSSVVKSRLILDIQNTADNFQALTSKENSKRHGLGLPAIRKTVEKYCGIMEATYASPAFTLTIMLPINRL